jgi:hypothetical protein
VLQSAKTRRDRGKRERSVEIGPMMKGKNNVESSSSGVICWCGRAKLERGMSTVKNGGAPRRLL